MNDPVHKNGCNVKKNLEDIKRRIGLIALYPDCTPDLRLADRAQELCVHKGIINARNH